LTRVTLIEEAAHDALTVGRFLRARLKLIAAGAEELLVRPKIRLDAAVKLEERHEEQRLNEMSEAGRQLKEAEEALAQRRARAGQDSRRLASASDWQLSELSHARVLSDVRVAEQAVGQATAVSSASRDRYAAAYNRAEALRRVAATRVDEILRSRDRAERREHDELGILRHGRDAA
jgi:flagellar biosynthesis chaperone FliJ